MKPGREKHYWLYGVHACVSALQNPARQVSRIVTTRNAAERITAFITGKHPKPEIMEPRDMDKLLPADATHQGVAIQVAPLPSPVLEDVLAEVKNNPRPFVLLDQVTDPHNVGAILRSAAAFDAAAVVVTRHHAPEETAAMAKAASGAMDLVPLVAVGNLAQAMEIFKKAGYWCIGLDGDAKQTIKEAKLDQKTALVLGAEGKGLRRLTGEQCDLLVRLPISDKMESLNVSNAAAVALYELRSGRS